jgi:ABC-type multidrug transport system ATPase subunit
MEFTQLSSLQEKEIAALSKGLKQRLCLAKTLLHDPSMLILDEPAAGLDPRARVELRELLRALAATGKAILLSSHILTELAEMCDGVAVIERGEIKATARWARSCARCARRRRSTCACWHRSRCSSARWRSSRWSRRRAASARGSCSSTPAVLRSSRSCWEPWWPAGCSRSSSRPRIANLEELFLALTEGKLQ